MHGLDGDVEQQEQLWRAGKDLTYRGQARHRQGAGGVWGWEDLRLRPGPAGITLGKSLGLHLLICKMGPPHTSTCYICTLHVIMPLNPVGQC